jgi:hypothetical protein
MTTEEIEKINYLFNKFKIKSINTFIPNSHWITNDIRTVFVLGYNQYRFGIRHDFDNKFLYTTPICDSFEQFYDELIIFKELILPKYL